MLDYLENLVQIVPNDEKVTTVKGKKIIPPKWKQVVDINQIDIYKQFDINLIPDWKPNKKLPPFDSLKIVHLDIETDLDVGTFPEDYPGGMWNHHPIVMIGLMDNKGKKIIIHDESEALMLRKLFHILHEVKPDILTTFNGFDFDLPYIIGRAKILGLSHPFQVDKKTTCHQVAQRFAGEPAIYKAVRLTNPDGSHCAIIDLYHQLLAWDFVARKLEKYTLKAAPVAIGLRKEPRLDLGGEGIKKAIVEKNWELLKEYLIFDLEDTKDLGNFLLPALYYQKLFLDWNLQAIATGGNGSKWNDMLMKAYGFIFKNDPRAPQPQDRFKVAGGYTLAFTGLYENVMKLDVASLYPHVMLYYGIYDKEKDPEMKMLSILKYLLFERLRLKKIAGEKDEHGNKTPEAIAANQMQGSLKVLINSAIGACATQGINFNSYKCNTMVTAIGRKIANTMIDLGKQVGCNIATVDTDGVAYENKTEYTNAEIHEHVQSNMPPGIKLEYEWFCEKFFVPPNNDKKSNCTGLKKCYVMINLWEEQKDKTWKMTTDIKVKGGRYKNRSFCKLDKKFQPTYLSIMHNDGLEAANAYYENLLKTIESGLLEYDEIRIKKRIAANEKTLPACLNKPVGSIVSYYRTNDKPRYHKTTGKRLEKGEENYTETEAYNAEYYANRIKEMVDEIHGRNKPTKVRKNKGKTTELKDETLNDLEFTNLDALLNYYND